MGFQSGFTNTTGANNVFMGYNAGFTNEISENNVFIGSQAGYLCTVENNTCVGGNAGYNITTGYDNTTLGLNAGYGISIGFENTCIGRGSGGTANTGSNNVLVGSKAGSVLAGTSSDNTFIGTNAGSAVTAGTNVICIGYDSAASSTSATNEITLGSTHVVNTWYSGWLRPLISDYTTPPTILPFHGYVGQILTSSSSSNILLATPYYLTTSGISTSGELLPGVWLLSFNFIFSTTQSDFSITVAPNIVFSNSTIGTSTVWSGSVPITTTYTSTSSIKVNASGGTVQFGYMTAVRIA